MLLKTLSLVGFKSFADRTRLEFHEGVNVVVGPNGSGKSNLLDALAWVMGTQATSVLRTESMEDVIFAGTATRPSLGRAEVTLSFDNTDQFLPIELDEVSMTRRLYRDGTSEYELNGTPCRLLDLHELLSDGGVGRHQHVLVGQGQIGNILNARPDEHRAVIEEAAGITKHRARRDRSVRRLEQTEIDVHRLIDLLDQQKRRLRPLKRQANAAERYDSVRAQVLALRMWIGGETLRSLRARLEVATAEREELVAAVERDSQALAELVGNLDQLRGAAGEVGRSLERDTAAAARLETVAERFQRIGLVSRERRHSLESRLRGAGERRDDLVAERDHLVAEIAASAKEEQQAQALAGRREVTLHAMDDEERSLAEQIQLPTEGVVANLRGDLRALETAAERDRREAEGTQHRREVVESRITEEQSEATRLNQEIRSTDSEVGAAQEAYTTARTARTSAQEHWERVEVDHHDHHVALAAASARVDALEAALAGIGDPAAREFAANAAEVLGPLVTRLDVPAELAVAVDGALGRWRDAFVVSGDDAIRDAAGSLRSEGYGGVAFVGSGPGSSVEPPAPSVAAEKGFDALIDLLGRETDRDLAAALVGDVVLCEGWSAAWALVQQHPELRAVTPEGDVVTSQGLYLAEPDGAGPAALEAAKVALEIAERNLARSESSHTSARRDFNTARDQERTALEALEALEARLAGLTEALGLLERSQAEGTAEIERLDERGRSLDAAAVTRDERIESLRRRVEEFEGEEKVRQEAWDALNRRREEVARRRDEARRLREEAAGTLAGAIERRKLLETRLVAATTEFEGLVAAPVDPAVIERLADVEDKARGATEMVRDHIEALRTRQRQLRERAGIADNHLTAAHRRQSELERAISGTKERAASLAVELAELRVRDESVAEGLRRDADRTEEEALAAPEPELEGATSHAEALATAEASLRRMGPINPLAAAEYRELGGEVEMLDSQLEDLEESRRELLKVIDALDEEMAVLFRAAFDDIAGFFEENFSLVFPGGRGRLRLTDPDHPLATGVELEAQPMGKKVGRLSLLSGGERSLAALAFLFAVFRARPSPFYVLDEVEAALDDANLRRFLRLVDTLRETAQLVIITHQQQTMEAADILYGVTMEPGASSKVIAKRLARVEA